MDKRRLTISLVIFAAGVLLLLFYTNYKQERDIAERHTDVTGDSPTAETAPADTDAQAGDAGTEDASDDEPDAAETIASTDTAEIAAAEPETTTTPSESRQPQSAPRAIGVRWLGNRAKAAEAFYIGSRDARSGYTFELELTSMGAAVKAATLAQYFTTVEDKQLWEKSPDEYETVRQEDPETYQGRYRLLAPVAHGRSGHLPYQTGLLTVSAQDLPDETFDLSRIPWRSQGDPAPVAEDADSVSFAYTLAYGSPGDHERILRLTKTYTVRKQDFSVEISLSFENLSDRELKVTITQDGPTGIPREDYRSDMRQGAVGRWSAENQAVDVELHDIKKLEEMQPGVDLLRSNGDDNGPVVWVGVINKYFGSMMYMRPEEGEGPGERRLVADWLVAGAPEAEDSKAFVTAVTVPGLSLKPGQSRQVVFDVFAGPKKRDMFADAGSLYYRQQYKELNYVSTISLRGCFCAWSELSLGMMWLLQKLSVATLGNYGLAIIVLVICVRAVLHPLTKKSQVSMHKMQKLAPQMQRLKEKYADDKEALNREMMNLYKKTGASPFLGCLPMLLQMPIWIALYTGLNASVELRHAGLLPFWLTDLAAPDTIFSWSPERAVPLLGWHRFSLLPILMAIAMALQSKFNPQMSAQASMSPEQAKQQKMMKYMFPAVFLFIFYQMPSGLNLYIMTSTFVGVAEQYLIRKHLREKEATQAAMETTVKMPGKPPRSKRPKKPKGPFYTKHG